VADNIGQYRLPEKVFTVHIPSQGHSWEIIKFIIGQPGGSIVPKVHGKQQSVIVVIIDTSYPRDHTLPLTEGRTRYPDCFRRCRQPSNKVRSSPHCTGRCRIMPVFKVFATKHSIQVMLVKCIGILQKAVQRILLCFIPSKRSVSGRNHITSGTILICLCESIGFIEPKKPIGIPYEL